MSITRKLKKMGQFQVVVELANGATIFDSTNKTSEVDDWLASFDKSEHATSIKVYTKDEDGIYGLLPARPRPSADLWDFVGDGKNACCEISCD